MAWEIIGNNGTNPNDNFLGTIDNEPLVIRTNNTERLRLDANGNVGIGTTNSTETLTVNGNSIVGKVQTSLGATSAAVYDEVSGSLGFQKRGTTLAGNMGLGFNASEIVSTSGNLGVFTYATGYLALGTHNTERLRVDENGNVGIGTGHPNKTLSVNGTIETNYEGIYFGGMFGVGGNDYNYGVGARESDSLVYDTFQYHRWRVGTNEKMTLDGSGNLGIGTTNPQSKLDVQATGPNEVAVSGHSEQFVGIQGTSIASAAVSGKSSSGAGVYAESVTDVGVYATTASNNNNVIRAISTQYTEVPQILVRATNTLPGADVRLRMEQESSASGVATWDISVRGGINTMDFSWTGGGTDTTVLSLSADGNATLRGALRQNSSRALKDQIHDLACEEAIDALQSLNPVKFTLKSDAEAKRRLGFISEELPPLLASPDRATVSPMDIIAVLTKVVQAQQQSITALAHKIDSLERGLA